MNTTLKALLYATLPVLVFLLPVVLQMMCMRVNIASVFWCMPSETRPLALPGISGIGYIRKRMVLDGDVSHILDIE